MAAAAAGGGAGLGVIGSIFQGDANADMANRNAGIADQNAKIAENEGTESSRRSLVQSGKVVGSEAAGYGASGITGGSAIDVMRNSASQGELNALTIKHNADIRAMSYRNSAALDRERASNSETAGYLGAASALIGGGAKMFGGSSGGGGGYFPNESDEYVG